MKQDLETEITNMEQPDLEKVKEIVDRRLFSINQNERIRELQDRIKRLKSESFESETEPLNQEGFDYTHR